MMVPKIEKKVNINFICMGVFGAKSTDSHWIVTEVTNEQLLVGGKEQMKI